jgi:hypothetical protein
MALASAVGNIRASPAFGGQASHRPPQEGFSGNQGHIPRLRRAGLRNPCQRGNFPLWTPPSVVAGWREAREAEDFGRQGAARCRRAGATGLAGRGQRHGVMIAEEGADL